MRRRWRRIERANFARYHHPRSKQSKRERRRVCGAICAEHDCVRGQCERPIPRHDLRHGDRRHYVDLVAACLDHDPSVGEAPARDTREEAVDPVVADLVVEALTHAEL